MSTECSNCEPLTSTTTSTNAELSNPIPTPSTTSNNKTIDLLNSSTFIPPNLTELTPRIVIEFCTGCKWTHRAIWVQTELFITFPSTPSSGLKSINLIPSSTSGIFRVWLYFNRTIEQQQQHGSVDERKENNWNGAELIWDRKIEGGFPELKILKQRIRNFIEPTKDLGHSDKDAFGNKPFKKDSVSEQVDKVIVDEVQEKEEVELQVDAFDYSPKFRCRFFTTVLLPLLASRRRKKKQQRRRREH